MKNLQKLIAMLLCACMILSVALAQEADPSHDTVIVNVNGQPVTWADVFPLYATLQDQYGSSYDLSDPNFAAYFRAMATESAIVEAVMLQKAEELGLASITDEERTQLMESAHATWENGLESYISYFYPDLTEESAEADKTAARDEAIAYYNGMGYSQEVLENQYVRYTVLDRVQALMVQDATVTDEEVEDEYQRLVAADKELYENDLAAYVQYNSYVEQMEMYAMMYGMPNEMEHAWYRPAGLRNVRHILLEVDEALMSAYTDLSARYEEQQHAEEAAAEETEEAAEPVTEEMINKAKADILASVSDKVEQINQKILDGVEFDDLIAEYTIDPGANSDYALCAESTNYVPEFVEAGMSLNAVGDVSAPYISNYGVHIVKYVSDVPAGPVEMTDAERYTKAQDLLSARQNALWQETVQKWLETTAKEYTGVIPTVEEAEAALMAAQQAAQDVEILETGTDGDAQGAAE